MEDKVQKSWFSRNWGWLLGGGCLVSIIFIVTVIGGAIWGVTKAVSESGPYNYAYEKAINNEDVKAALGEPLETSLISSNTKYSYNNGEATVEMRIPLNGSLNSGDIFIEGFKENDEWTYTKFYVDVENNDFNIELLEGSIQIEEDIDNGL